MARMPADKIIYNALVWAEESMLAMLGGLPVADAYRVKLLDELKQMRAYRNRRFGKPKDPFAGTRKMGIDELRRLPGSKRKGTFG